MPDEAVSEAETIRRRTGMAKDWIVRTITLSAEAERFGVNVAFYPYHVFGVNVCGNAPETICWQLPNHFCKNDRYELGAMEGDQRPMHGPVAQ